MTDARIKFSLPRHPKTKKLIRMLNPHGEVGAWYLVCLMIWTCQNRPSGDLSMMTDEDIELAVDWPGSPGLLIESMVKVGFLEGDESARKWHDWHEHQTWASNSKNRSDLATWSALQKFGLEHAKSMRPDLYERFGHKKPASRSAASSETLENGSGTLAERSFNGSESATNAGKNAAPLLSSPTPTPLKEREKELAPPMTRQQAHEFAKRWCKSSPAGVPYQFGHVEIWLADRDSKDWQASSGKIIATLEDAEKDLKYWLTRNRHAPVVVHKSTGEQKKEKGAGMPKLIDSAADDESWDWRALVRREYPNAPVLDRLGMYPAEIRKAILAFKPGKEVAV